MSQDDIYEILKELGGEASTSDIRKRAKEKFPDRSLYSYVTNRLKKMEKKGILQSTDYGSDKMWEIVEDLR